jgi:hypothetical protein
MQPVENFRQGIPKGRHPQQGGQLIVEHAEPTGLDVAAVARAVYDASDFTSVATTAKPQSLKDVA